MKASLIVLLTGLTSSLLSDAAFSLEKRAVRFDDSWPDEWSSRNTCRVQYYNICTGWIWCWSGFQAGDRLGMVFDACTLPGVSTSLLQSMHFICSSAPAAYGFTGTISVYPADANNCPVGNPIVSQPFLPHFDTYPFQWVNWAGTPVTPRFAMVIEISDEQGLTNPAQFGTDRPAAGPTGPNACGTCYPMDRPNHSFLYGSANSPLCPGTPFNDGVCDAQLFWAADMFGEDPKPSATPETQFSSWGAIKALFR